MIVKFHARGKGGGGGPVGYLLGRDGQREDARLDRGDPEATIQIIDGLKFAKKYTSGVLSFAENDLPEKQKQAIMDKFEQTLLPGLDKDQYQVLWVQHKDKDRLELNFVIPNVELRSGKRLQPYWDPADRPRVNAFKNIVNADYNLSDPDDPAKARPLTTPNNLPKATQECAQVITDGLLGMVEAGLISTRSDIKKALAARGLKVVRETKNSISIENPYEGGRNIRLKGALYAVDVKFGPELQDQIQEASDRYRAGAPQRLQDARELYSRAVERKRDQLNERYNRPQQEAERPLVARTLGTGTGLPVRAGVDGSGLVVEPEPLLDNVDRDRAAKRDSVHSLQRCSPESLHNSEAISDDRIREDALADLQRLSEGARDREEIYSEAITTDSGADKLVASCSRLSEYAERVAEFTGRAIEFTGHALKQAGHALRGFGNNDKRETFGM